MLVGELFSGAGGALKGWEDAGFEVEWTYDPEGPARRIQKESSRSCSSAIPVERRPVDLLVAYCGSSEKRLALFLEMLTRETPPCFLVETESLFVGAPVVYDTVHMSLNSARFFVPHARMRHFCIGVLSNRNPGEAVALLRAKEEVLGAMKEAPIGLYSVLGDSHPNVIMPPSRLSGRMVHSPLRPLPEVHSGAGKPHGSLKPHESDAGPVENAVTIDIDTIQQICGVPHLRRPDRMDRKLWFKWIGKCLDPTLACLLGVACMGLLKQGYAGSKHRRIMICDSVPQRVYNRKSKLSLIASPDQDLATRCSEMQICFEPGPPVTIEYRQGSDMEADLIFNEIADVELPDSCVTFIKQRTNQRSKLEDVHWLIKGETAKSKKALKDLVLC